MMSGAPSLATGTLCAAFSMAAGAIVPDFWHLSPDYKNSINLGPLYADPLRGRGCAIGILESFAADSTNGQHPHMVRQFLDGGDLGRKTPDIAPVPQARVGIYNLDLGAHTGSLGHYDIVNMSFQGLAPYWSHGPVNHMIETLARVGRGGLGALFFSAAGNNRNGAAFYETDKTRAETMTIGATGPSGRLPDYSPRAPYIFMVAPGDYVVGGNRRVLNGTSFATPMASAVGCLIKQANPALGYRDIQDIFALTARRHSAAQGYFRVNASTKWNGTGYAFDDRNGYGFGLIDAYAAVRLAESWPIETARTNRTVMRDRFHVSRKRLENKPGARSQSFTLSAQQDRIIEHIGLHLAGLRHSPTATAEDADKISITLTSPAGTKVRVFSPPPHAHGNKKQNYSFTVILGTHHFRGESLAGTWTIEIDAPHTHFMSIDHWDFTVTGHSSAYQSQFVYTNDFGHGFGPDRVSGSMIQPSILNAAAVAMPGILRLDGSGPSQIAGRPLTVAAETITGAIGGDGDDHIVGPRRGATILMGGRGNDTIEITGGSNGIVYRPGLDGDDVIIAHEPASGRLILRTRTATLHHPVAEWAGKDLRLNFGPDHAGSVTLKDWKPGKGIQFIFHEQAGIMTQILAPTPPQIPWYRRFLNLLPFLRP